MPFAFVVLATLAAPPLQDVRDRIFVRPLPPAPGWQQLEEAKVDPAADEWPTEVLCARAKPVLDRFLSAALSAKVEAFAWEALLSSDFVGASALAPHELDVVAAKGVFEVRRPRALDPAMKGKPELAVSVRALRAALGDPPRPELDVQVTALEPLGAERFATRVEVRASGRAGDARTALNFAWRVEWALASADAEPRIRSIVLERFERVTASKSPFAELTGWMIGAARDHEAHLLRGIDDYYLRNDSLTGNSAIGGQGIALGDIDQDGDDDLYVPLQGGLPNRLYVHEASDGATERGLAANVGFLDNTRGALLADFDGDGDQDLAVAVRANVYVTWNDGRGTFSEPTPLFGDGADEVYSLAAADADGDADLDLFACRYTPGNMVGAVPLPYFDATNGAPNIYWRNDGSGGERKFTNATKESGFDENNARYSLAALWDDFDDDGDPDLWVANDFGRDNLYVNDGKGHFSDRAGELGVDDIGAGMGLTTGDVDLDGDLDVYVSDMWSADGLRITARADRFQSGATEQLHAVFRHHARGNTLWLNQGGGKFVERAVEAGANRGGWAWGSLFSDFENDGLSDLYVPNGFLTWRGPGELSNFFWRRVIGGTPLDATPRESYRQAWGTLQALASSEDASYAGHERNCVYLNLGEARFADVTAASGVDYIEDSRAVARCDWDDDGREDLWLKSRMAPRLRFLHNRSPGAGHWLQVDLVGTTSNRDAIGARVTVEAGGKRFVRTLHAGEGYLAQSSKRLHFGLGAAERIDRVSVRWPWGASETIESPPLDRRIRIVQGSGTAVEVPRTPRATELAMRADEPVTAPRKKVTRIPLVEKLPMAGLALPTPAQPTRTVASLFDGRPILLRFWSSRMAPDDAGELVAASQGLAKLPVRVVLVSVDQGPALVKSRRLVASTPLAGDACAADGATLEVLEAIVIEIFRRSDLAPLPLDLLLDAEGQLVLLYFEPVEPVQLGFDLERIAKLDPKSLATPRLFGSRWLVRPRRNYRELSRLFEAMGNPVQAEIYARIVQERTGGDATGR